MCIRDRGVRVPAGAHDAHAVIQAQRVGADAEKTGKAPHCIAVLHFAFPPLAAMPRAGVLYFSLPYFAPCFNSPAVASARQMPYNRYYENLSLIHI